MTLKKDGAEIQDLIETVHFLEGLKDNKLGYPIPENKKIISGLTKPKRKKTK